MFVLTVANHPEGVFSLHDDDENRVIPIWTEVDDANRYLMMIQEEDYPDMQVCGNGRSCYNRSMSRPWTTFFHNHT